MDRLSQSLQLASADCAVTARSGNGKLMKIGHYARFLKTARPTKGEHHWRFQKPRNEFSFNGLSCLPMGKAATCLGYKPKKAQLAVYGYP